jgi:hypothetical protein
MKCIEDCRQKKKQCKKKDCRMWVDYPKDLNCTYESINKNSHLSLREVAKRLDISFVRVKQIEQEALNKLLKRLRRESGFDEQYLKELLLCE